MRLVLIDDGESAGDASGSWRGHRSRNIRLFRLFGPAMTVCALVAGGGDAARAQVLVDGPPDAVHVEARDATLQEVMAALGAKFNLSYRSDDALETRKTGNFDGPLPRVMARVLDGYDFAIKVTPQGFDVLVLRQDQAIGKTVFAVPAVSTPKSSPAPLMTAAQANRYEREHFR